MGYFVFKILQVQYVVENTHIDQQMVTVKKMPQVNKSILLNLSSTYSSKVHPLEHQSISPLRISCE